MPEIKQPLVSEDIPAALSFGPLLQEYKSLRDESIARLRLQNQIMAAMLTMFAAMLIWTCLDWRGLFGLLIFPCISTFFLVPWFNHEFRRFQITSYISDRLEPILGLNWETYIKTIEKIKDFRTYRSLPFFPLLWLFIATDLVAVLIFIFLAIFSQQIKLPPPLFIVLGLLISAGLIAVKYFIATNKNLEKQIAAEEPTIVTVIKETHRELYPRSKQMVMETGTEVSIPPCSKFNNFVNSFYEQMLLIEQGVLEIRDGSVSPEKRLENSGQYVKICVPGDIAIIPPGVSYILANPGEAEALIRHQRIFVPRILIR